MVETARDIGLDYLGVSDHFVSETQKDGLDLDAARVQRQEVARLQEKLTDFTIFQGIEVDVNRDGTLPVDDEALDFFDYVIAAFPDLGDNCKEAFVDRVVVAAENPRVTILGTPVGDHMLRSCEGMSAMRRVLDAAVKHGKAVELDASPNCPEIDWSVCRLAQEMGV
ncbi:MAG: DNA polymerase (family 10), partial [Candidatus Krumholzibacteriia bacterium]